MEGGPEAGEVTLRIKSPSAALGDVEVRVGLEDCVLEVKRRIALVHQARPPPAAQKLVYLGKILGDEARLEEFLRLGDGGAFTLHLVLAPAPRPARSEPPEVPEGLRHRAAAAQPVPDIPRPAAYTAPPQESMEEMMREFSAQYTAAMSSLPPAPSAAEMAAMQDLYSQYLGLYLQYLGQQPAGPYQQLLGPAAPAGEGPPGQQVAGPEQGGAPGGPAAGIVMNAGGGGAVAQEAAGGERHRDLLDWVYVLTRVMLLFSVIYFHSSFWRLAMVAGLGFLVFLYQARQEGRGRRVQAVPAPAVPAQPGLEEEQEEGEEAEEEDGEEGEEEEQPKPSRLAVAVTFLTSLVSSIIPEQQQVV